MPTLTDPIIPYQYLKAAQEAIDPRSLTQSPLAARLRGFGAGALEGLYGQLTPLNIGLAATGALGAAGRGLGALKGLKAAPGMADAAGRSLGAAAQVGPVAKGLMRGVPQGAEEAFLKYMSKPW